MIEETVTGPNSASNGGASASQHVADTGMKAEVTKAVKSGAARIKRKVAKIEVPKRIKSASKSAQREAKRRNDQVKSQLGPDGPLYILAGVIGLATLGIFAYRRR